MAWLSRRRERRAALAEGFRDEWRAAIDDWFEWRSGLDHDQRSRHEALMMRLMFERRWEAGSGFELDDEVRLVIAALAARIAIGLPDDPFRTVTSILVQADDVRMTGEFEQVAGIVSDEESWVSGLSDPTGPVMLSWDAICEDLDYPGDGRNLVYHEFAHQLDQLDGHSDGVPPIPDAAARTRFIEVCTAAYELAVRGEGATTLDEYAGVNPAEFFAVATEAFFDAPMTLRGEHRQLYEVLSDYFGQDPAQRPGAAN
ncbi:MAG: M90 family metallopeptidase [Microthrixaceae bacterium]|nr:zinc-dependent peptidase [Microthrixaceae bacterium]MCO5311857.1 M90 family metallopeptidase [Microthrixaceae bacterium]HPB46823.1 M90 family metallopeptidase [Microthrixaceae bacterium]